MDIKVETTSRNLLFLIVLVVASSSKIFINQASEKVLQTQSMQRHKQKLIQSKQFLVLDEEGHHYMPPTKTLPNKNGKISLSDDYWLVARNMKEDQGEKKQLDISGCLGDMQG